MRYFETKEKRPKKLIPDRDYHSFRFFLIRICVGIFILGFVVMFFAWIYRKQWANFRTIQGYALLVGGIGWFSFMALAKSLGISIKGITYSKFKAIMRNEVEEEPDADLFMRKQVHNSLFKMSDDWTLFPTVYGANEAKKIAGVITGPGGIYPISFIVFNPKDRKFVDPGKPLLEGTDALESKLNTPVEPILVFRKYKKNYQKRFGTHQDHVHMFTLQELNAFIKARTVKLEEQDLAKANKTIAKLSDADMSQDLNQQ